ncbi:MAG: undecaprenyl-phosphate glucose phosphotransferase [Parvibaculum sp.]|nr:undecaprenyl-phosphate glucose phosphotransferase [Parvibaculum sp.]
MKLGVSAWRKNRRRVDQLINASYEVSNGNNPDDHVAARFGQLTQPSKRVIADSVMFVDFFVMTLLALVAQWIYITLYLGSPEDALRYLTAGAVGAFVAVATIRSQRVYVLNTLETLRGQNTRIAFGLVMSLLVLLAAAYLLKVSAQFSRGWMMIWFGLSFPVLFTIHALAAGLIRRWQSFGLFVQNVAVYGSGEIAQKLIEHLGTQRDLRRIVGVYDDVKSGVTPNVVISGGLSDLIRSGQSMHFDEVLIALPMVEQKRIMNAVAQLSILPTNIRLCPDLVAFQFRPTRVVDYDGVTLLEMVPMPMDNWAPIFKATEDRVLACIALFLVMPVMILVAVAIKLDSPGPIFFRQRRHGFNHKIISVLKFRSMNVQQDGTSVPQAKRKDPRVTRVGKILRKTSLDELPQLFNVLRGDMSLVGPRPHALSHNEHYQSVLETYASRHKVKPGITGWAQINGYRGETDTPDKMRKRVEHDLYYIEHWSLWLDLKILFFTPFSLFSKNVF